MKPLLDRLPQQPIWLAVSGGMDSMVLWDLMDQCGIAYEGIVHVNHGLHKDAHHWEALVREVAQQKKCPIRVLHLDLQIATHIEEKARIARYTAMQQGLPKGVAVICAHHKNDQYETMLFRLFRGADVKALSGMHFDTSLYGLRVLRPLLSVSHQIIQKYAALYCVRYIDDPSNLSKQFSRNKIRQDFGKWIQSPGLSMSHEHLSRQSMLLTEIVTQRLTDVQVARHSISIDLLSKYKHQWQIEIIHLWLLESSSISLSLKQIESVLKLCQTSGGRALVEVKGVRIRRYKQFLTVYGVAQKQYKLCASDAIIDLGISGVVHNPHGLLLEIRLGKHVAGAKKQYQSMNIPCWMRPAVPVIQYKEQQMIGCRGSQELRQLVKWCPHHEWHLFLQWDSQSQQKL